MQSLLSVVVVMACCGLLSASPARTRRSLPLPDGVPLEALFAACGDGSDQADIGPCVEQLLSGIIEMATPSFATGLEVGGKTIVLEPLAIDDIKAKNKPGRRVRVSVLDILVSGLSSVQVKNVTLLADQLGLNLSFSELVASANLSMRAGFITARPQLKLTLEQPSIHIRSGWELQAVDGKLGIGLNNVTVDVEIEAFSTQIGGLSGLGRFLENFLNNNNQILLDLFKPLLEKKAKRLLEKEFKTIKLSG